MNREPVTKGKIDSIRPSNHWILATNSTSTSWEDTSSGAEAIVYWDEHNKQLKGLVYSYYKDSSPWSQGDKYYLHFDDVLKTNADLKAYRNARPPSSKGRWASPWDKRWSVRVYFNGNPYKGDFIGVNSLKMKLGDFFKQAKEYPYRFISPAYLDWGVLNMRFMDPYHY